MAGSIDEASAHISAIGLANNARVAQRVQAGGHAVPEDKVNTSIPRTLRHIATIIPLCDHVYLLNNSSAENPFIQVTTVKNGVVIELQQPFPGWA